MSAAPPRRALLGLCLDALTMEQTVARCVQAVENRENLTIGVVNASDTHCQVGNCRAGIIASAATGSARASATQNRRRRLSTSAASCASSAAREAP